VSEDARRSVGVESPLVVRTKYVYNFDWSDQPLAAGADQELREASRSTASDGTI
jgi:hypothetical protein